MTQKKQISPNHWSEFLEDFSTRNNNRRARFQIFKGSNSEEEIREAHFETASIKDEGKSKTVTVVRIDRTEANADKIHDTITNVIGITIQYDTDGSEAALEINDKENELVVLRFESEVDGVS